MVDSYILNFLFLILRSGLIWKILFAVVIGETILDIQCKRGYVTVCAPDGPCGCPVGYSSQTNVGVCGFATLNHYLNTSNIAGRFQQKWQLFKCNSKIPKIYQVRRKVEQEITAFVPVWTLSICSATNVFSIRIKYVDSKVLLGSILFIFRYLLLQNRGSRCIHDMWVWL